jgi:hypothetical protein
MNVMQIDYTKVDLTKKKDTPTFFYHGGSDLMIKLPFAKQTYKELQDKGLPIDL